MPKHEVLGVVAMALYLSILGARFLIHPLCVRSQGSLPISTGEREKLVTILETTTDPYSVVRLQMVSQGSWVGDRVGPHADPGQIPLQA